MEGFTITNLSIKTALVFVNTWSGKKEMPFQGESNIFSFYLNIVSQFTKLAV